MKEEDMAPNTLVGEDTRQGGACEKDTVKKDFIIFLHQSIIN
jgi:hypothetical protein